MIRRALLSLALLVGLACAEDYSILMSPTSPDAAAVATEMSQATWTVTPGSWALNASTDAIHIGVGQQAPTWDSAIAIVRARNRASVIFVDTSVLTSAGGTLPNVPITVFGNQATLTASGAITVAAAYRVYDLNVAGDVVYAGASTDRYYLTGGSRIGNVTLTTGLLHDEGTSLLSGTITVNGGTFECISTTITSQISHTAGNLLLQKTNVNATKTTALIASTATSDSSSFQIVYSLVTNLGTGTAIDISANTQATAHANVVANTILTTASAASMISGAAVVEVTACDYSIAPTGTGYVGTNWGFIGNRTLTGTLSSTGAPGYDVYSSSLATAGRIFYTAMTGSSVSSSYANYVSNAGTGNSFYSSNLSGGYGFRANGNASAVLFYGQNTSGGSGTIAIFDALTNNSTGQAIIVKGGEASAWSIVSSATTLYKYSARRISVTAASTLTIGATAIAANSEWIITSRNVAVTLATSGSLIYHGTELASSVTIPATQSLIRVVCDGTYVYIY